MRSLIGLSRARWMMWRLRRARAQMSYAQRRMFELRTGLLLTPAPHRGRGRVDNLEALFALEARDPDDPDSSPNTAR
jgi:hypothetical protein